MQAKWYAGSPPAEREQIKAEVLAAKPALDRLRKMFQKNVEELEASMRKETNYESPAWAYLQADRLGAIRELNKAIALLTIEAD